MARWRRRLGCLVVAATLCACGGEAPPVEYEGDEPGECTDGADNDQDQAFDCDDDGCAGAPVCQGLTPTDAGAPEDTAVDPGDVDEEDTSAIADVGPDVADVEADVAPDPVEPPVDPAAPCQPLAAPDGLTVELSPSQTGELGPLMATAEEGTTFLLTDGVYTLDGGYLWLSTPGVTVRSKSGDASAVVLDGGFQTETAVTVAASGVTLAELTIRRVLVDAVRVQPDPGTGDVLGVRLHGLIIEDALSRGVVVDAYNGAYVDGGVVSCSHLTLSEEGRARFEDACGVGGVELRQAAGWTVRDNRVDGLWCDNGAAAPAILAWRSSADTVVERNRIDDGHRGIGLGEAQTALAGQRTYPDVTCDTSAHVDHYGGIVRNNMLFTGSEAFLEAGATVNSGIHLWSACGATAVHNTVVALKKPFSSIEWRFEGTVGTQVLNNLVSHNLMERTGATAFQLGNLDDAEEAVFVDWETGDLHLAPDVLGAINAGEDVPVGLADHDFEGELRLGVPDIGADELVEQ